MPTLTMHITHTDDAKPAVTATKTYPDRDVNRLISDTSDLFNRPNSIGYVGRIQFTVTDDAQQ